MGDWRSSYYVPAAVILLFIALSLIAIRVDKNNPPEPTEVNMETLVKIELEHILGTKTMIAILSATPTFTRTPLPTITPIPTETPTPTFTVTPSATPDYSAVWFPAVMDPPAEQSYSSYSGGSGYTDYGSGTADQQAVSSDHCLIWGNVNGKGQKIYHCPNDQNYHPENFNSEQGDQWFCSVAEATAAGFRAPKNAPDCGGF